jgi:hypothetical protein
MRPASGIGRQMSVLGQDQLHGAGSHLVPEEMSQFRRVTRPRSSTAVDVSPLHSFLITHLFGWKATGAASSTTRLSGWVAFVARVVTELLLSVRADTVKYPSREALGYGVS